MMAVILPVLSRLLLALLSRLLESQPIYIYGLSFRIHRGDLARHYRNTREMQHFSVAVDSVLHAQGVGLGAGTAVSLRFVSPTSFSTLVCKKCAIRRIHSLTADGVPHRDSTTVSREW